MITAENPEIVAQHTAVLSRLNYTQFKDGKVHYYPKEEFEKAIPSFNDIPILYGATIKHPATGFKGRNLEDVLKETGGKIVGYSNQALINNMGSPKLQSLLNITDPELEKKILNGEIAISPGFWYSAPDVGSLKNITGDHVLLYDRASGIPQGDVAAMIVNQSQTTTSEKNGNNETAYFGFSEGYLPEIAGENMAEPQNPTELATVLQVLKTNQDELNGRIIEKEKELLKLNQDIENKDAEIIKLNQDIEKMATEIVNLKKTIEDEENLKLKNQQDDFWGSLLEGTQEKFKERREELSDPRKSATLYKEIFQFEKGLEKPNLKQATGNPFLMNNQDPVNPDDPDVAETIQTMREIKSVTGR